jgi:hypothetical protein
MRIRRSTSELCFTRQEFRELSLAAICRRLGLGDHWLDEEQDAHARELLPS